MKKILVTTDFSANAKAGIRFALNLSTLSGFELVFYHGMDMQKPSAWNDNKYNEFITHEKKQQEAALTKHITQIYKERGLPMTDLQCVVEASYNMEETLIAYAQKINADFICMSTRGAGIMKKLFGSTASKLVTTSPVPLIVVPHAYRAKPMTSVWYASDLDNLVSELDTAYEFAKNINAKIDVVNYSIWIDEAKNKKIVEAAALKYAPFNIAFHLKKLVLEYSLAHHLNNDLKKAKPALLILFTKQNRGWFDRIFLPSESADLTFDPKVPLVIFRK